MKIFLFGSELCPDCIVMKDFLEANRIRHSYIDILGSLGKLKMFLKHRDTRPEFEGVRQANAVGIPYLFVNDGEWTSLEPPSDALMARLRG